MYAVKSQESSSVASSRKSKYPYGNLKASAAKKSILNLRSSGASSNGSKLSHGTATRSESDRTTKGLSSFPRTIQTLDSFSSSKIRPIILNVSPFPTKEALICAFAADHFLSRSMASSRDELMFLPAAFSLGSERAACLATKHRWKCQRPLRALRAMLNEHDRNYDARSATARWARRKN